MWTVFNSQTGVQGLHHASSTITTTAATTTAITPPHRQQLRHVRTSGPPVAALAPSWPRRQAAPPQPRPQAGPDGRERPRREAAVLSGLRLPDVSSSSSTAPCEPPGSLAWHVHMPEPARVSTDTQTSESSLLVRPREGEWVRCVWPVWSLITATMGTRCQACFRIIGVCAKHQPAESLEIDDVVVYGGHSTAISSATLDSNSAYLLNRDPRTS